VANLAMFPLGLVLFPGMALPLHIFEPRYRQLVEDCLSGEPSFGVSLITHGKETGGGERRSDVSTLTRIIEVHRFDDGRFALTTVGLSRIRVLGWYADDPYPQAEIEPWPDESDGAVSGEIGQTVRAQLRDLLAQIGGEAALQPLAGFPDDLDASEESFALCAMAPLDTHDRQRLLCAPGPLARLLLLSELLEEQADIVRFTLGGAT
jgi:uncharacterized protein